MIMTIKEAFEAFEIDELLAENRSSKTIKEYRNAMRSFMRANGNGFVSNIEHRHILMWKMAMQANDNMPSYVHLNLRMMRRVLTYLRSHGYETYDPAKIKLPLFQHRETAWLTIDEMAAFLRAIADPMHKALFAMQFSSGARISELLGLNLAQADEIIETRCVEVVGKGSKKGVLNFDNSAIFLLKQYLPHRSDGLAPLFLSREHNRFSIVSAIQAAHRYAVAAGIEKNVTTHVLRHSFATNLSRNGMDIADISRQMRHSKVETTQIYVHSADHELRNKYDEYHSLTPR